MSEIGHNSVPGEELEAYIVRIERLAEEKQAIQGDISDIFGEMKGKGYDAPTVRKIIAKRKKDRDQRLEEEALLAVYMRALKMDFDEDGI